MLSPRARALREGEDSLSALSIEGKGQRLRSQHPAEKRRRQPSWPLEGKRPYTAKENRSSSREWRWPEAPLQW